MLAHHKIQNVCNPSYRDSLGEISVMGRHTVPPALFIAMIKLHFIFCHWYFFYLSAVSRKMQVALI